LTPKTVSDPDFWNDLYISRETGWDKGRIAPPLVRMLAEGHAQGGPLLVLAAGRGHDALHAARLGLKVTAVDFAFEAVEAMQSAARGANLEMDVLERDLFTLPQTHAGMFASMMEHTAFCAIDPARATEYAQVAHSVLKPGGVFFGLFYAHGREGGPPYNATEPQIREVFGPLFTIERLRIAADSFPSREGEELEFVMRRL
jgi:methyl halide transferase